MATRKQLLDQNDNEILPITDTESVRNPQSIGGTLESRLATVENTANGAIKGVQQNGVDLQKDEYGKVNVTVQDGKSALQIYNETYGTNLDEAQFINVLKQSYPMEYVAYDQTAAGQPIGTGFSAIDTLNADSTTAGKMYLMPNNGTTPTGTILFVTVQTPNSNPATYQWYSLGGLSVPSNVLTEDDVDDTQLVNPVSGSLAKAEDVMQLKAKLEGVTASETKAINYTLQAGALNVGIKEFIGTGGSIRYTVIPVGEAKRVRFLGVSYGGTNTSPSYGFGFYNSSNKIIGTQGYEGRNDSGDTVTKEYVVDIPDGAVSLICSVILASNTLNESNFYCYLQSGENVVDLLQEKQDEIDELNDKFLSREISEVAYPYVINAGSRLNKTYNLNNCIGLYVKVQIEYSGESNTYFSINCGQAGSSSTKTTFVGIPFDKSIIFRIEDNNARLQIYTDNNEQSQQDYTITLTPLKEFKLDDLKDVQMSDEYDYTDDLIIDSFYNTGANTYPSSNETLSGCRCYKGEIKVGDILHIKGKSTSINVGLFAFYDADLNKIFSVQNSAFNSELFIKSPDNAAYFVFNCTSFTEGKNFLKVIKPFSINNIKNEVDSLDKVKNLMWEGKNVVCFGDSITEFTDSLGNSYTDYIREITGANVINVGIGGTHISKLRNPVTIPIPNVNHAFAAMDIASLIESVCSGDFTIPRAGAQWRYDYNGDDNRPIVERLAAIDFTKVDIVTIFAGVNDWNDEKPLGESDSTDVTTVKGAINYIIQSLLSTYPKIKLYWFTPIVHWAAVADRTPENWGDNEVKGDVTLEQFAEAIKSQVYLYKIPTCDMYHTLGWNQYNFNNYFRTTDGTHPYKGFYSIGRKVVAFIDSNRTF